MVELGKPMGWNVEVPAVQRKLAEENSPVFSKCLYSTCKLQNLGLDIRCLGCGDRAHGQCVHLHEGELPRPKVLFCPTCRKLDAGGAICSICTYSDLLGSLTNVYRGLGRCH